MHYKRWRNGRKLINPDPVIRFWQRVDKTGTCWNWTGPRSRGYGDFNHQTVRYRAHRYSYELLHGPIADDKDVDHICHNTACVNPDHLRLVTAKQNAENRSGPQVNNTTSGIRGVYWDKGRGKWHAHIGHDGQKIALGRFATLAEAEAVVIRKRNELFTHNNLDRDAT